MATNYNILSFENTLAQNGYPSTSIIDDGTIHRFGKNDKLWYISFGTYAIADDWSGELNRIEWRDNQQWNTYSENERHQKELEIKQAQAESEKIKLEAQAEARIKAKEEIDKASTSGTSEYLERKKLDTPKDIHFTNDYRIIIPIFDINGELTSLQYISDDGNKQFLKDGKIKGCFHTIGSINDKTREAYVCEGYATGLTIYNVTKKPVIVCFYAGNIMSVLDNVTKYYDSTKLIITADNDAYGDKNTGKIKAEEAGKKFGYKVLLPKFKDISTAASDFNDLYCLEGENEVKRQLRTIKYTKCNITELMTCEIPKREYLIAPIIKEGGSAMLFASRGVGKTFVSLGIGFALASGQDVFNGKWIASKPRKVFFIDGEMDISTIRERLESLMKYSKVSTYEDNNLQFLTPDMQEDSSMPDLSTKAGQNYVEELIDDDVALIIIDNISTLCRTGDENDAESWQSMQDWIRKMNYKNIAVLLVHHTNKKGKDARGTSKKEDTLHTAIKLEQPLNYKPEQGARFIISYTKNRHFYGDDAKGFEVSLVDDGNTHWSVTELQDDDYDEIMDSILEYNKQGMSSREIAKKLGVYHTTITRRLSRHNNKNK